MKIGKTYTVGAVILFVAITNLRSQQADTLFQAANTLYDQSRYAEALDAYQKILRAGYESPELYLNMGNAAYQLNRKGPAVYYYEKALRLDPHFEAARSNLELVRRGLVDHFTPLPQSFFHRLYLGYAQLLSLHTWGMISLTAIWLALVFGGFYLFSKRPDRKRSFFGLALVMIIIWAMAYLGFTGAKHQALVPVGIIQAQETHRYQAPSLSAGTSGKIHEGTRVQILQKQKDWLQVRTVDGNTFWIPTTDVWLLE